MELHGHGTFVEYKGQGRTARYVRNVALLKNKLTETATTPKFALNKEDTATCFYTVKNRCRM